MMFIIMRILYYLSLCIYVRLGLLITQAWREQWSFKMMAKEKRRNFKEKDVSIRTARSPEFETDVDSSYGLQMRQMSTIRIGNFKSFPMDPAPSPQDRSLRPEDPGVSGLTPDDPERNSQMPGPEHDRNLTGVSALGRSLRPITPP